LKRLLFLLLLVLLFVPDATAQKSPIQIKRTEFIDANENEIPGAIVFTGNVEVEHDGVKMYANKVYHFKDENYIKAFGDFRMNQGDTLFMNSEYAEYNGNKKFAYATGKVNMKSPDMRLVTDTIFFDRMAQQAYYNSYGTIYSGENVLKSKSGRYFMQQKKYQFLTAVTLTNPKYVLKSNHLDYYTNSGHAYVFGPSTITGKDNYIYTEKGFYDTKKNLSHLLTNSYIKYDTQIIKGDSIYYDRNREFSSATNNVSVTDTVNKFIVRGHYGEVYKKQDSLFIERRAVAVTLVENDSLYTHAKRLVVTGKPGSRIMRGYNNARFYKIDMSGKCDSIHSDEARGLTQLIKNPVVWNGESQLTGDVIHIISNSKTEQVDSLKVLNNAFIIQKDTLGTGYNQVKGKNMYGKFRNNELYEVDLIGNAEKILYSYDDDVLFGIDKGVGSSIKLEIQNKKITSASIYKKTESQLYPEADLPQNVRKLRGFVWRGDERIKSKEDIFPPEEQALHDKIVKDSEEKKLEEDKPMEPLQQTLDYDKNNPKPKAPAKNE
jgi:lipopolysaccharide export system protein LptA